jgi:hypothetical protein
MAITTRKLFELFEVSWLMMRQNPGGKSAYLQRCLLGFAGTVNVKDVLKKKTVEDKDKWLGTIKIKVGSGEVQTKTDINFSIPNIDLEAVGPDEAAKILEGAGFTDCKFSLDEDTNRLRLEAVDKDGKPDKSVRFIQVYGDLAAALNFGNCRGGEGKGCYLWASTDGDLKGVAETEEWGEDKKIENDSPIGNKVSYSVPGKRGGTQIVVTDRMASREAKQMINGGIWKSGGADNYETYEPPVAASDDTRRVDVFTFSKIFDKNDNTAGDELFVRERMYIGGVGHMARSGGAGSWSDSEYTLTFGTFMGEDNKEHASPKETDYTQAQWEALGLDGIIEMDWENAGNAV